MHVYQTTLSEIQVSILGISCSFPDEKLVITLIMGVFVLSTHPQTSLPALDIFYFTKVPWERMQHHNSWFPIPARTEQCYIQSSCGSSM